MSSATAARKRGEVLIRKRAKGTVFALRFWAYGKRRYLTLGYECDGWVKAKAEEELREVLANVRRGLWVSPQRWRHGDSEVDDRDAMLLFGPFAVGLPTSRKGQVATKTSAHDSWALGHLLPFFAESSLADRRDRRRGA